MAFRRPSDALSDAPARPTRRDQDALRRQARRVQVGIPISGDPRPFARRTNAPFGVGLIPAVVISSISACSGTTPGTGTAQLYYMATPDDTSATADQDNSAVPVLNWLTGSGTVATGKHIFVFVWSYAYWLAGGDC